jgi:ZIP family zinc transporter
VRDSEAANGREHQAYLGQGLEETPVNWFAHQSPLVQAIIATSFMWLLTGLGACAVLFTKRVSQKFLDAALAAAAGIMVAATFWSLLAPAIEMAEKAYGPFKWLPTLVGFLCGVGFLRLLDRLLPLVHQQLTGQGDFAKSKRRTSLLVLALTIHNFPEGLAVGVAFGAAGLSLGAPDHAAHLGGAIALALAVAIQDLPEGLAVALPLRREGMSRAKAVWYGQLSGVVEPAGGIIGAAMVLAVTALLPYALAFSAGVMLVVAVTELVPESLRRGHVNAATTGLAIGFAVMMVLEVYLG